MKAVIFDLDGVVVNTAHYHYLGWKRLAEDLGFEFDVIHNERQKGVSRMESLEVVLEVGNITNLTEEEKIHLADKKNGYYLEMIQTIDDSEILPGIEKFLQELKVKNYKIALGSASKSGRMILEKLDLVKYFDVIVDGNMVQKPKPDPQVFLTAADLLHVPYKECIVVEDAAAGVEAAKAGGMKCIGIGSKDALGQADIVIDTTEKLLDISLDNPAT